MRRAWLLTAAALCASVQAEGLARVDWSAAAAWKGWSRPGRTTEIEWQSAAAAATTVDLQVLGPAGTLVRSHADLAPGQPLRLHLPVAAAPTLVAELAVAGAAPERREITLALSESPLLGLALADGAARALDGFKSLALSPQDLPRQASAYSSIDALVLDTSTLAALDARQLAALLAHAGACGRIAVVNRDERVRRMLDGAAGCGGRMLLHAADAAQALSALEASLAHDGKDLPAPPEAANGPGSAWQAVAVGLATYFAASLLLALFASVSWPMLVLPAAAALAAAAWLPLVPAPSPLVVWAEGEAGDPVARYRARQEFTGLARGRTVLPIPAQLADAAQPCPGSPPPRLAFDAAHDRPSEASFETRLFGRAALCFAGGFPMKREPRLETAADGPRRVRNGGATAWPAGWWIDAGGWRELPPLAAGAAAAPGPAATLPAAPVTRQTQARVAPDRPAALWQLDLAGVGPLAPGSQGWLLVPARQP